MWIKGHDTNLIPTLKRDRRESEEMRERESEREEVEVSVVGG